MLDLGAGTGALSAAILDALPGVRVVLVDVDRTCWRRPPPAARPTPGGSSCATRFADERRRMPRDWYAHMARHGIGAAEADAHLAAWADEDHYVPLPDEPRLLAAGGFPRPYCFWRDGGLTVYGAPRD